MITKKIFQNPKVCNFRVCVFNLCQNMSDHTNDFTCSDSGNTSNNRNMWVTQDDMSAIHYNAYSYAPNIQNPYFYQNPYLPQGAGQNFNYNIRTPNYQGPPRNYFYNVVPDAMFKSLSDTSMFRRDYNTHNLRKQHSDSDLSKRQNKKKHSGIQQIRVWEDARTSKIDPTKKSFDFTLMSFNVLAQDLIDNHKYLYTKHFSSNLKWKNRWENLLKEIQAVNPDILCLQEVQESHIPSHYDRLKNLGYDYIFKKRTNHYTDGCAIYFKTSKLKLTDSLKVEYKQSTVAPLDRENVGLIAKFEPLNSPGDEFVVATTHLLYNPRRDDVRLAQVQLLLAEIDRVAAQGFKSGYSPVIITGDFNSLPNSSVYDFVTNGHLDLKKSLPSQKESLLPKSLGISSNSQHTKLQLVKNLTKEQQMDLINIRNTEYNTKELLQNQKYDSHTEISHNFPFKSVYQHKNAKGELEGTTYQERWVTVDYIFYSGKKCDTHVDEDNIKLLEKIRLPTNWQLKNVKIPDDENGSDHLALTAKFKIEF